MYFKICYSFIKNNRLKTDLNQMISCWQDFSACYFWKTIFWKL